MSPLTAILYKSAPVLLRSAMHIHAYPSGSLPPLLVPLQAPQCFSMGAFMCKIIFPCYLALKLSFLEKLHILFKTASLRSYCQKPEYDSWDKLIFALQHWNIIGFTVSLFVVQEILLIYACRDICEEDKPWTRPSTVIYIHVRNTVSTDPVTCVYW